MKGDKKEIESPFNLLAKVLGEVKGIAFPFNFLAGVLSEKKEMECPLISGLMC
jgi:hypothetical protein